MAEERERINRRLKVISGHLLKPCSFQQPAFQVQQCNLVHPSSADGPIPSQTHFEYTEDNGLMTNEDRQFYEKNGFFVVKGLVGKEDLLKYRNRFNDICDGKVSTPFMTVMKDITLVKQGKGRKETTVNKLQDFQLDPVLSQYFHLPEILKYVECFTGPDIMAVHTMLINKPPDPGTKTSRHPMHQDLHYFPFRPADKIVCSWTAMEKVNRANGCLVVLPGTHKGTLLHHEYPNWEGGVNKFYHGIRDFDPNAPRMHLEMEEGDTVFFHPILIHGSGTNSTTGFRKAISCHYASSHCQYINVKGTSQQNLEVEIQEIAKRRFGDGIELNMQDAWQTKRIHVQGEEGTL